jgi:hypothetical protein
LAFGSELANLNPVISDGLLNIANLEFQSSVTRRRLLSQEGIQRKFDRETRIVHAWAARMSVYMGGKFFWIPAPAIPATGTYDPCNRISFNLDSRIGSFCSDRFV